MALESYNHSTSKQTYEIVNEVTSVWKSLVLNTNGYFTDGEVALHLSLKESLANAICLRCFAQFQRNCIEKLNTKQKTDNRFSIHDFNKSRHHLEFLIYDVIREKTSAAIFEF